MCVCGGGGGGGDVGGIEMTELDNASTAPSKHPKGRPTH